MSLSHYTRNILIVGGVLYLLNREKEEKPKPKTKAKKSTK